MVTIVPVVPCLRFMPRIDTLGAFSRQGTLERLFHSYESFYPQAFLSTSGNFHGNKPHGIFKRINVHSTAHSLLCSRTERGPFQYKRWVNRITEAFRSHTRLPEEIRQISEEMPRETETTISIIRPLLHGRRLSGKSLPYQLRTFAKPPILPITNKNR